MRTFKKPESICLSYSANAVFTRDSFADNSYSRSQGIIGVQRLSFNILLYLSVVNRPLLLATFYI